MGAALVVLVPLAIAIAWRIARGGKRTDRKDGWRASEERMQRVEDAVQGIAADVEHVSEGHRFLTKVFAEKPAAVAAQGGDPATAGPQAMLGSGNSFFEAAVPTRAPSTRKHQRTPRR